jgi:hypothetical protein
MQPGFGEPDEPLDGPTASTSLPRRSPSYVGAQYRLQAMLPHEIQLCFRPASGQGTLGSTWSRFGRMDVCSTVRVASTVAAFTFVLIVLLAICWLSRRSRSTQESPGLPCNASLGWWSRSGLG